MTGGQPHTNPSEYVTISEPSRAQTRVQGSRFFGTVQSVQASEDVIAALDIERKKYHDATHWCFAARISAGSSLAERSSDAGEPRGTAGMPILREIQKRNLSDCLVIVTRYFGGTKLGKGNLARAYAGCAASALDSAIFVSRRVLVEISVECCHDDQSIVYAAASRLGAAVNMDSSSNDLRFKLKISPNQAELIRKILADESRGRIRVTDNAA